MQEGVTNPSPASLKDVVFCRLLSRSLPQFLVADGVRPVNLENPFEKGVDECLESASWSWQWLSRSRLHRVRQASRWC